MADRKTPEMGRTRRLVALLALAAPLVPLIVWHDQIRTLFTDPQRLVDMAQRSGPWGPLTFIGMYVTQVIVAPIPGQALNFAAGYLFGPILGVLYSWIGLMLGTIVALLLARYLGRPLLRRLTSPATLDKIDRLAADRGLGFFFLVFLIPGLPDDIALFVAGLTPLPLPALIAISTIGRLPSLVASVWLGVYARQLPWQGWLIVGGLTVGIGLTAWRYGERIQDAILKWLARHS